MDRAEVDGLRSEANRRVDFLFCIGWNFLEPVPDKSRKLTKEECAAYDREKFDWVAIECGGLPDYDPGVAEEGDGGCGGGYEPPPTEEDDDDDDDGEYASLPDYDPGVAEEGGGGCGGDYDPPSSDDDEDSPLPTYAEA